MQPHGGYLCPPRGLSKRLFSDGSARERLKHSIGSLAVSGTEEVAAGVGSSDHMFHKNCVKVLILSQALHNDFAKGPPVCQTRTTKTTRMENMLLSVDIICVSSCLFTERLNHPVQRLAVSPHSVKVVLYASVTELTPFTEISSFPQSNNMH